MPRNSDYSYNEKEDMAPATSRFEKNWGAGFHVPSYVLEIRSFAAGAGSIRIGELTVTGFPAMDGSAMTATARVLDDTLSNGRTS